MSDLVQNKERVFETIAEICQSYNRAVDDVSIVAVTKYVGPQTAKELVDAGVQHIGENRVDKFLEKYHAIQNEQLTWHLIGTLQRRKVKDIINLVDYFHALDSVKLAKEIDKRADHQIKCFLQVNISGEESKHGFAPENVFQAVEDMKDLKNIELVGLMTMAPFEASEEECDQIFSATNALRQELADLKITNMPFTELSMGMSRDVKPAIKNGATFVRIGTSFFS